MVKLTEAIKDTLTGTRHIYLATAAPNGTPNVVVVGAFKLLDDERLLISDQFFKKTAKNLAGNKKVAIAYWGEKGGYQLKGTASIHQGDKVFADDIEWMKTRAPRFKPKAAVVVKINAVYALKAGPDAGKKLL